MRRVARSEGDVVGDYLLRFTALPDGYAYKIPPVTEIVKVTDPPHMVFGGGGHLRMIPG